MTRAIVKWHSVIGVGGFALLLFLHLDFWRPRSSELYFGWLPEELGYRVLWMLLAWAYLVFFCRWLWPEATEPAAPARPEDRAASSVGPGDRGAAARRES